ncbi:glucosyl-3-phosphoglycerate synthase [Gordonia jinhuaensis]|uniref:Glucosyl-3-phosphoglycerate synthase n=1 Tax=Gordonia jinhuaensis TaxID=1517702 RepID=A0A916SYG5_9ACTN|nr:glucosyl-3-phosphoglycerate synthase [Gordonia jinhuaensis]GGB23464.1 hypothetical protein GCM10011489_09630 [Gordonia jinhuaensis]
MTGEPNRTITGASSRGVNSASTTARHSSTLWPAPAADFGDEQIWSATHTWERPTWTIDELILAKGDRTVSVVLPALNEEETVADVIASIRPLLGTLVDELVVLDSGSTDATAERARAAGAQVVSREQAVPELEPVRGKGEVLWRSIAATTGDLIAFVDSDLIDPDPMFVPKLLGPLLINPEIQLVKGYYRRPLLTGGSHDHNGGGRVTELVARPLLASLKPELSSVLQPLGGEYAGTRELLSAVPFAPGYGVEIGLLVDTYDRYGLSGIGQVNLGVRTHRNRPLIELGVMSRQIVGTLMRRCGIDDSGVGLTQFFAEQDGSFTPQTTDVYLVDRPAMNTLRPGEIEDVRAS